MEKKKLKHIFIIIVILIAGVVATSLRYMKVSEGWDGWEFIPVTLGVVALVYSVIELGKFMLKEKTTLKHTSLYASLVVLSLINLIFSIL